MDRVEAMSERWVYLDGELMAATQARVSVQDRGLLLGLGAFETMRAYGGRVFRLGTHLARLGEALRWLEIEPGPALERDRLYGVVGALLARNGLTESRLRLTVTAGLAAPAEAQKPGSSTSEARPTVLLTAEPVAPPPRRAYEQGVSASLHRLPRGVGPLGGHKLTSYAGYVLARRGATRQGAAEALLIDRDDQVVEGAFSNVFAVMEGEVWTPPLEAGALPGVTRQVVLELLRSEGLEGGERALKTRELVGAQEVFLTSSVAELLPVVRIGGEGVGHGGPGPMTRRLWRAYRDRVRRESRGTEAPTSDADRAGQQ